MTDHSFEEWTAEERGQLADVGRHRSPRSELKVRTLQALHVRGLVGDSDQRRTSRSFAFGLAAAVVVFAAGMLAGYGVGLRHQPENGRDSITNVGSSSIREIARLDSTSAIAGRHVVWF